jgi:cytochrome c553
MVSTATSQVYFRKPSYPNFSFQSINEHYINIKKLVNAFSCLVLFLWAFSVQAEEQPASYNQCIACHGEQAQGNEQLNAPSLAGLSATYLTRQLANFSSGLRGSHKEDILGKQMLIFSKQLDKNKDIPKLTAYLSNMPLVKPSQNTSGDLKNGSRYYQAKCGACHGGKAQGNSAFNAPKLAGQNVDYLNRQMKNFVNGIRGTHKDDKLGRQMAMMAKTTSGNELADILHYIATQE